MAIVLQSQNKTLLCAICALVLGFAISAPTSADAGGAATLANDCSKEIKTYCSKVTPGHSRVVACLISYEDRISPRCRLTAYLGSGTLNNRLKHLQAMAKTCSSDILQYCSQLRPGGGRIYDCIKKNRATLTDECRAGLAKLPPL
jgi:cysteine rich repeat protein